MLSGEGGFNGPAVVLEGLSREQALAKPHGLPHSIAEIVARMCFWQEWFNACATRGFAGLPEHAAEGWPAVAADGWDGVRTRCFAAIEEGKRIAAESEALATPLLPPGVAMPFLAKVHSGHHLGQIITLRQLLGAWPPAAGSMTW